MMTCAFVTTIVRKIFSSSMQDSFAGYNDLVWQLSFTTKNISFYSFLAPGDSVEKFTVTLMCIFKEKILCFSLVAFNILSLFCVLSVSSIVYMKRFFSDLVYLEY